MFATIFRLQLALFGACFVLLLSLFCDEALSEPRFGLWIEAEGTNKPFLTKENYDGFISFTEGTKFTDYYCQVYRGGRAWYPSMMADDAPYRDAKSQGFDPIGDTIAIARKRGVKVHAWVNALRLTRNFDAPMLKVIGRPAVLTDSYGTSILDYDDDGRPPGKLGKYFQLGTPGIWLEPSSARVRQYVLESIRDVIIAYPELDGIHLDMVRFPFSMVHTRPRAKTPRPRYGFSQAAVQRFYDYTGRKAPEVSLALVDKLEKSASFRAWQRSQVTLLVFEIRKMIDEIAPHMEFSAAVIASQNKAVGEVNQDWPSWMQKRIISTAHPMNYSRKLSLVASRSRDAMNVAGEGEIIVGLGAWMIFKKQRLFNDQGLAAMKSGARGVNLFSYSNLYSPRGRKSIDDFTRSVFPTLK